jgi:succinate dehydrogenase/fumarate reductase cytochrome b subunit
MNPTLVKAVVWLVVVGGACVVMARAFLRTRATGSLLELLGAAGLGMLGVTHLCEGLRILPWMRWGIESGPGHYLNLASLATGLVLIPTGYALNKRSDHA